MRAAKRKRDDEGTSDDNQTLPHITVRSKIVYFGPILAQYFGPIMVEELLVVGPGDLFHGVMLSIMICTHLHVCRWMESTRTGWRC